MPGPSLKCVVAWSNERNLCSLIGDELRRTVAADEIRRLGDETFVVSTNESADALRDRLRPLMRDGEGLLVIDFEVWSGYGKALNSTWLLRRGH